MSDLSNYKEAREWLRDTVEGSGPHAALRRVESAAHEQRQNYERCVVSLSCPIKLPGYKRAVEMLEKAVPRLRKAVDADDRARAAKAEADARAREAESARLRALYPQRR